jgi:hypothetical protein
VRPLRSRRGPDDSEGFGRQPLDGIGESVGDASGPPEGHRQQSGHDQDHRQRRPEMRLDRQGHRRLAQRQGCEAEDHHDRHQFATHHVPKSHVAPAGPGASAGPDGRRR